MVRPINQGGTRDGSPDVTTGDAAPLVSLGAGALRASILAFLSGGVALSQGSLAAQHHDVLMLAGAVGLIDAVLTALFKTGAFEPGQDEPTPLPLYLEHIRLSGRPAPVVRMHFCTEETELLKQIARSRPGAR